MVISRPELKRVKRRFILTSLIFSFILTLIWDDIVITVHSGHHAIYWSRYFGGTLSNVLGEGAHLKLPWDEITEYPTKYIESRDKNTVLSTDGLNMTVEWSIRYSLDSRQLPNLHRKIGQEYFKNVVEPEATSWVRSVIGNLKAEEVYVTDEEAMLKTIEKELKPHLMRYGIILDRMVLLSLSLPEDLQASIVKKQQEEQTLLAYKFRNESAQKERERRQTEASGLREFEQLSGISALKWKALDVTSEIAKSNNSKIIIIGPEEKSLPLLLNSD